MKKNKPKNVKMAKDNHGRSSKLWKSISFVLPIGLFLAILFPYLDYLPMWDSGSYISQCVLDAVRQPFNLMSFNCFNHGSIVFGLLYAGLQYISFGNSLYMHLSSFVLLIIGFCFYYAILKHFFRDQFTVAAGMMLLCWNPAIVANAINPTPDLLVLVFSIICLWAFLNQYIAYAALSGLALIFTKESGIVFYGLCGLFYFTLFFSTATNKGCFVVKNGCYLCVPLFIYSIFLWYKINYAHVDLLFKNISIKSLINQMLPVAIFAIPNKVAGLSFSPGSPRSPFSAFSAIYSIALLNFQWIIIAGILLGLVMLYFRQQQKAQSFYLFDSREMVFVFLLTVTLSFVLSRYPHFFNVRYYLLIFPLTTLLFIYIFHVLAFKHWRVFTGALAILLIFSCFYTIDPVSRWFFGTFNFGSHALLNMTSRTKECCGYGRDQLVYNLQHTEIQTLLKQFAAQTRLNSNDAIIADDHANYMVYERLGNQRYAYALCLNQNNSPTITHNATEAMALAASHSSLRIFYPQLPNLIAEKFNQMLLTRLISVQINHMTHHGYTLNVMQMTVPPPNVRH